MIIVTSSTIAGMRIVQSLGLVYGNTVRCRHAGKDIMAALRNLVGGEVPEYTKMLAESREQSLDRMALRAEELGANAVVDVRFTTSAIMQGASELLAYGTAVLVEPEKED
ncbi:MAG TPA: YbjQ family protein [Candidatus Bathyarchaeia archaeon]|nr:YbjQ family protein [Candidatus Bathyarchaeia archaeon]